jgi:hypothetical protein
MADQTVLFEFVQHRDPPPSRRARAYIIKRHVGPDGKEVFGYRATVTRLMGKTTPDFLSSAFWAIVKEMWRGRNRNMPLKVYTKTGSRKLNVPRRGALKVEDIYRPWAVLALVPDEGIPCQNIRPTDRLRDKESLFASCDVIDLLRADTLERD